MLIEVSVVIAGLTDQRKSHLLNSMGQMKGIRLSSVFDDETREFLTLYFTRGKKAEWLRLVCDISFQLKGINREILLHAASFKRSTISQDQINAFPKAFVNDLDQRWRSVISSNGKRSAVAIAPQVEYILQTPSKLVCRRDDQISPSEKQVLPVTPSVLRHSPLISPGIYESLIRSPFQKSLGISPVRNVSLESTKRANKITAMRNVAIALSSMLEVCSKDTRLHAYVSPSGRRF